MHSSTWKWWRIWDSSGIMICDNREQLDAGVVCQCMKS